MVRVREKIVIFSLYFQFDVMFLHEFFLYFIFNEYLGWIEVESAYEYDKIELKGEDNLK